MTLEELSLMTCQFGSTHCGKTFIDLWENNQVWIAWMVSHYGKSQKIEHRRLLEFIEIEGSGSGTTPLTDQPSGSVKMGYPKAKTMPKPSMMPLVPQAKPQASTQHQQQVVETSEIDDSWSEAEMPMAFTDTQADVAALQERMLNLETML